MLARIIATPSECSLCKHGSLPTEKLLNTKDKLNPLWPCEAHLASFTLQCAGTARLPQHAQALQNPQLPVALQKTPGEQSPKVCQSWLSKLRQEHPSSTGTVAVSTGSTRRSADVGSISVSGTGLEL